MRVAVLAYDGFTDVDLFLPWDFLWRVKVPYGANYAGAWEPRICADKAIITSDSGVETRPTGTIADVAAADGVFIVNGDGSREKLADQNYLSQIRLDPARQRIAAIDSGVLILAALGLLDGLSATTYPTVFAELEAMGVRTKPAPLSRMVRLRPGAAVWPGSN